MDSHAAEVPGHEVEQLQEDEKRRALESVAGAFYALKRLIAEHDRLKAERDIFEGKIAGALDETETLRIEIKRVKAQRDHLSNALSTITAQLDTLASRIIEAVKMARLQAYGERPAASAEPRPVLGWDQARQPLEPSIPRFLRDSPEEFHRISTKPRDISEKRTLADHLGNYEAT
jgi:hypothetical protein